MATTVQLVHPTPIRYPLRGFGGQFDCELFTKRGQPNPVTKAQLAALQQTVNRLKPGHSRIFVTSEMIENTDAGKAERKALMDTIEIADRAGANVNLTWWHGPYFENAPPGKKKCQPRKHGKFIGERLMEGFAGIIEEARKRKFDCVTHVTIQNEVNDQDIGFECDVRTSQELYKRLYKLLGQSLKARPGSPSSEAHPPRHGRSRRRRSRRRGQGRGR